MLSLVEEESRILDRANLSLCSSDWIRRDYVPLLSQTAFLATNQVVSISGASRPLTLFVPTITWQSMMATHDLFKVLQ